MLRAFVISLGRYPERRQETIAAFAAAGIGLEVFEAVDGADEITFETGESVDFRDGKACPYVWVSTAQIGCYLSHYRLLRRACDEGWERVLVFEDDARPLPGLRAALTELAALPASFELVRLYCPPHRRVIPGCIPRGPVGRVAHRLRDGRRIIRLRGMLYQTVAYTMSRAGIGKFLDQAQPIRAPLDIVWAYFWRLNLASYVVSESLAKPARPVGEATTMTSGRPYRVPDQRPGKSVSGGKKLWHLRDWFAYHAYLLSRRGPFCERRPWTTTDG